MRFLICFVLLIAIVTPLYAQSDARECPKPLDYKGAVQPIQFTNIHSSVVSATHNHLKKNHYLHLNQDAYKQLPKSFFEVLDPRKIHFTKSEIQNYQNKWARHSYFYLEKGILTTIRDVYNTYRQRATTQLLNNINKLSDKKYIFDFERDTKLKARARDRQWAGSLKAKKQLQEDFLQLDLINIMLNDTDEQKARERLIKRYRNALSYLKQKRPIEVIETYLNALGSLYDPHTSYLSPRKKTNFNINLSLSLEGIGAIMRQDEEFTEVVSLISGGPAKKYSGIKPNDYIIGIGEGNHCPILDVVGWRLDEVVDLIRGPKGSKVRLEVKSGTQISRIVQITRDTINLDDQAVKHDKITYKKGRKIYTIGIIQIPSFYLDIEGFTKNKPNFRNATSDVKNALRALGKIDGLVLDLRNNGGGSLLEATKLSSLFLGRKEVVQIRHKHLLDHSQQGWENAIYNGPLIVAINRLSASSSEILAGALQDYDRAIIFGSTSFGKGTVQNLTNMPLGSLKYTQSKFYRPSGNSTQERGVEPIINLPSQYDPTYVGESSLDNVLPWDRVDSVQTDSLQHPISAIVTKILPAHKKRIKKLSGIKYLQDLANVYKKYRKDYISTNLSIRQREKKIYESQLLDIENTYRVYKKLPELTKLADKEPQDDKQELEIDDTLREAGNILIDTLAL